MYQTRTIVVVDLYGYSDLVNLYEQGLGANTVAELNEQIQGFVDGGAVAVGIDPGRAVLCRTGDGAILMFDSPDEAHRFAAAFFEIVHAHNRERTEPTGKRPFRMGAATGEVAVKVGADGTPQFAGMAVARAKRMEEADKPGDFLIDPETFDGLPPNLQAEYGPAQRVRGKRKERFVARRRANPFAGPLDTRARRGGNRRVWAAAAMVGLVTAGTVAGVAAWPKPDAPSGPVAGPPDPPPRVFFRPKVEVENPFPEDEHLRPRSDNNP